MEVFRVRLNCVDHYQSTPTPYDPLLRCDIRASQRQNEPKIPVIRVFGSTETGQKVCAHIHGAFPYLYIEYTGSLASDDVRAYINQLHLSIDHALAVSYQQNAYNRNNLYIARITLVKGVPFYGYFVGYKFFLKIYVLNPLIITRLSDLFRQGAVMKKIFQPYEAHLQYLLQWMTDYNLYGCGYINCRKVYFRAPVPKHEETENLCHLWHDRSIPAEYITEGLLPRVSHCSIEVDLCVQDIMNREDIRPRLLHHNFIECLNPLALDEKLVQSMAGLWRDETRRRKSKMVDPDPGSSPFPPEVLISMSADPRDSQKGGWIHEEEYMDRVHDIIYEEKRKYNDAEIKFESFVKPPPFEGTIQTALESVKDLYPENLGPPLGLKLEEAKSGLNKDGKSRTVEADVNSISNLENSTDNYNILYDSEEEMTGELDFPHAIDGDHVEECYFESSSNTQPESNIYNRVQEVAESSQKPISHTIDSINMEWPREVSKADAAYRLDRPESATQFRNKFFLADSSPSKSIVKAEDIPLSPVSTRLGIKRPRSVYDKNKYNKRQRIGGVDLDPTDNNLSMRDRDYATDSHPQDTDDFGMTSDGGIHNDHEKRCTTIPPPLTVTGFSRLSTETTSGRRSSKDGLESHAKERTATIDFPVVDDPQESCTILRLSQGNNSQKNMGASPNGMVSFESPIRSSSHSRKSSSFLSSSMEFCSSHNDSIISKVLKGVMHLFPHQNNSRILAISSRAPSATDVISSMEEFNLPPVIYQDAYYSNESDVPDRAREYAGREFKLESLSVPFLADFDATGTSAATFGAKPGILLDKAKNEAMFRMRRRSCGLRSWEIADSPPSLKEVIDWANVKDASNTTTTLSVKRDHRSKPIESPNMKSKLSQIEGPSPKYKNSIRYTQQQQTTSVQHEAQYMSTMSVEIHVNTRNDFVPNPEEDEVQCIFWCLQSDGDDFSHNGGRTQVGIVVLSENGSMARKIKREVAVDINEEASELDLMVRMVDIVRMHDPDILTGYEVHGGSWGYLIERAQLKYDYNLCEEFSRMKSQSHGGSGRNNKWGFNNTSMIRVTGRHMINIWRAMRGELNLLQYTVENVAFHLLQRRIPHYSWRDLTLWFTNGNLRDLAMVLNYYISRVQLNLQILERNELIPRISEQARLLGVDFFSVISRGSQFKVESLMFRIAKPENFILISPSRKQVGSQNALECLPLVMEPQSAFYNSPLLVLDFQSLYPSVMIAYNYCYSTFLGRVVSWRGTNKMGFTEYKRQHRLLELLEGHVNIAPNGMMYVKPQIRKSLLAKMLGEILETRVMVKSGMKVDEDDKILQMLLNNRQLALKLIANVTYGYTSASFSGRMPCSEIADSIVQTARETLERGIALIHSVERWGAEVVYGDTDSLFIYLKGKTKNQAFDIGNEIVQMVTNMNPRPVKLKFEKVYFPCLLLAKKRYVGFKYESREQNEPEFDAKGIETVRRDGTPAEQKIEEKALKILFRTADLSQVKSYFQKQCEKIMKGSVSIQDFCFAREVRLGTYSEKGLPPPGALISTRRMIKDARAEPQYGERVPYVVITGAPGARLIDRCVAPETLLNSDHSELDAEYYVSKNIIPPLERIFNLVGANVRSWYDEMPKVQRIRKIDTNSQNLANRTVLTTSKKTIESYMKSSSCLVCREKLNWEGPVCPNCIANRPVSLLTLQLRLSKAEKKSQDLERVCRSCSGTAWLDEVKCDSKDCPVFYSRIRQKASLRMERAVADPVTKILKDGLEW